MITGSEPGELSRLPYEPLPAFCPNDLRNESAAADCRGLRIGILIVAYNALSTLLPVLKRITPNVWQNVQEVVVFDDASWDATYELAVGVKTFRNLPKLRVFKHQTNLGYGGNQKAGYRYFLDKGFDAVVLLHGDGQYAPEILSHLYRPIVEGRADAVFGSRMKADYGGPLKGGMPLYKYVGNRILTAFENRALGLDLTEFHCGYRAYSLRALECIDLSRMTDGFHFDTEIIIKLHHQRFRIVEVPIPTAYGNEICYVNGLQYARNVVRAVNRYKQVCRSTRRYPEFAEYFVNYPIKHSKYSSHDYTRRLVGGGHDVLDIGCGEGFFAAELTKSGNRIVGIDTLRAPEAGSALEQFFSIDLDCGIEPVLHRLGSRRFDYVLMLDILEHLRHPEQILSQAARALKANGRIIVSLPNVANITVRLMLLFGRFNYRERGILDRTHLRFYTHKTARRFIEESGYEIVRSETTVMPVELVFGLAPKNFFMRSLNAVLRLFTSMMPGLFGYQIVLVARKIFTKGEGLNGSE
jgi:2-polyprenyl-3-methyl-5-hydroxy-6-metoxy-1,4-benzoquinol methylase